MSKADRVGSKAESHAMREVLAEVELDAEQMKYIPKWLRYLKTDGNTLQVCAQPFVNRTLSPEVKAEREKQKARKVAEREKLKAERDAKKKRVLAEKAQRAKERGERAAEKRKELIKKLEAQEQRAKEQAEKLRAQQQELAA